MKKFLSYAFMYLVAALIIPLVSFAQDFTYPELLTLEQLKNVTTQADTNGSVNIYTGSASLQSGSKVKVVFDLVNDNNVQPQVKYSVRLMRSIGTANVLVDEKSYEEVLSLSPLETVHKEVEYLAPEYLVGTYEVWVSVFNQNSYVLGSANVGEVSLSGSGSYLEIVSGSCYLTVAGEDKKFGVLEGVDVAITEELVSHCEIKNNFKNKVEVSPIFESYRRTSQGELLSTETGERITLAAGEKRLINYKIPVVKIPQAYDAVLYFKDNTGLIVSNKMVFHYVVQGISATIQNLMLDKDYYEKGETAIISLFWTPSADISSFSRLSGGSKIENVTAEIDLKNDAGVSCANTLTEQLQVGKEGGTLSIPVINDCVNPIASITLKDSQGGVLDQNVFNVTTKSNMEKEKQESIPLSAKIWKTVFYVLGALAALVLIFVFYRRSKKNNIVQAVSILFFCLLGMSLLTQKASAWTVHGTDAHGDATQAEYTSQLNKSVYYTDERIVASGTGSGGYCNNGWAGLNLSAYIPATGESKNIFNVPGELLGHGATGSGSKNFTAPSTPGSYTMIFVGFSQANGYGSHTEYFTVIARAVCGDGKKEGSEQCDLGTGNGVCPSTCSSECTTNPECPCVTDCGTGRIGSACTTVADCESELCCSASGTCSANCDGSQCDGNGGGKTCCADGTWRTDCNCTLDKDPAHPEQQCCTSDRIWREKCTGCQKDSECATSRTECCSEEFGTCTIDQTYCYDADFRLITGDDITIYLTANPGEHRGSTRINVDTDGGFHQPITLSPVSTSPDDNLKNGMLNWSDLFSLNPLESSNYSQGTILTVKVPYDIIPAGTSKTYEMVIKGVFEEIEKVKNIKVKIYGQGWSQP